jgi:hypothetical protein
MENPQAQRVMQESSWGAVARDPALFCNILNQKLGIHSIG